MRAPETSLVLQKRTCVLGSQPTAEAAQHPRTKRRPQRHGRPSPAFHHVRQRRGAAFAFLPFMHHAAFSKGEWPACGRSCLMLMQRRPPPSFGQFADGIAAVRHDFPEADLQIGQMLGKPIRSFAAPMPSVSHAGQIRRSLPSDGERQIERLLRRSSGLSQRRN